MYGCHILLVYDKLHCWWGDRVLAIKTELQGKYFALVNGWVRGSDWRTLKDQLYKGCLRKPPMRSTKFRNHRPVWHLYLEALLRSMEMRVHTYGPTGHPSMLISVSSFLRRLEAIEAMGIQHKVAAVQLNDWRFRKQHNKGKYPAANQNLIFFHVFTSPLQSHLLFQLPANVQALAERQIHILGSSLLPGTAVSVFQCGKTWDISSFYFFSWFCEINWTFTPLSEDKIPDFVLKTCNNYSVWILLQNVLLQNSIRQAMKKASISEWWPSPDLDACHARNYSGLRQLAKSSRRVLDEA